MRKKLAILVNVIAPYRLPVYAALSEIFDTLILHGGNEPNRTWTVQPPPSLKTEKVFTIQIPLRKKSGIKGVSDTSYVHLNVGLVLGLLRFKPDIVLSNEMGLRTVIAIIYGKLARVPVWVWWGGTIHSERNISRGRSLLRSIVIRHVTRWVSYGATTTEYLEAIGVPRPHILQIQNCVPQETFTRIPSKPAEWFENMPRPVIITVGQLIQRKGLDKLIEACGRLSSRGLGFTLVLIGQGPEHDKLLTMAQQNGITSFAILPNQPQRTLNEIYRAADVFVFPTLEDVWGLVVNEALWTGTPVLCSKYAGCAPELLPASSIFDPMSPDSFDSALSKIFDGSLAPPDLAKLKTWQEVSDTLCRAIQNDTP